MGRLPGFHEIEVAALDRSEIGHLTLVDAVCVGDDPALGRLAARRVGAQSAIATLFARRILRMELTRVVLPTPGPPVITSTLETRATRTASRWQSASASFVRCSTQGIALLASINGQGSLPI